MAVVGVTEAALLDKVAATVRDEIAQCDLACSRFREDSELSRLNQKGFLAGTSEWFCTAVTVALDAAGSTAGLVDPTIGQTLIDLGYDRDFDDLDPTQPLIVTAQHVPAWPSVTVDRAAGRISLPAPVRLDLGATAKALCADRAVQRAATEFGAGVLVSLGGDIAVRGLAPEGGWRIRVTDRSDADPSAPGPGQTVSVVGGGLATSGTSSRRWARAGLVMHHLVDPRTGQPATEVWRTVSVAAPTCVAANVASTAAIVLGVDAAEWLQARGCDARLVSTSGSVRTTGDWPADVLGVPA
jgi:thiamine biosynthesis lipoprotein